ncbi:MAG TPA: zinc-binding dehydrogenase [Terrimesophilobacter sp.]|nr:zinc-binding dehydrogenase [Terrimesophilobacter sp.]
MTEPFAVAFNAVVERARVKTGDLVVIQGAGTIGILSMLMAKLSGANTTVVLGTNIDEHRLAKASELGADHVLDITSEDPTKLVSSLHDGLGADLVVDATGVSAALEQSLQFVRPFGSIAKVGWGPQPLGFSLDPLVQKAVTLFGSFSHNWGTWERVLALFASGKLDPRSVLGGVYAIDDWAQAFEDMESGKNVKSVMTFGKE